MDFLKGSRKRGTQMTAISLAVVGMLSIVPASADTIFTVNGVDVDSAVVDVYFEGRLGGAEVQATSEQREGLMLELRDLYILSTQESANTIAANPRVAAQIELQMRGLLAREVASEFLANVVVTDEELQEQYKTLVSRMSPLDYKARHILVPTQGEAIDVITQLNDGADFAQLAIEKSIGTTAANGGDLDWFSPDAMVPLFAQAVAALEDGKYNSEPVQTEFGWHVILREESKQSIPATFETARGDILNALKNEKLQAYIAEIRLAAAK